jgi:hypothetical protein
MVVTRLPTIDTEEPAKSRLNARFLVRGRFTVAAQVGI